MHDNYMIFPMETMNVTQTYLGKTSHYPHTTGTPKDYPIDIAGADSGRSAVFCPCDEMKITAIKGVGNPNITNTMWLVSTSPVITPTFTDIAFMTLTHQNDDDIGRFKVGDVFRRGDIIGYEGTDGATANHIHLVCGRGSSNNWTESTTGKWVITGDTLPPENVFYVDRNFTKVKNSGGLSWRYLVGKPTVRDTAKDQLEISYSDLIARTGPTTSAPKLGYIIMGIYDNLGSSQSDGYTWYKLADEIYVPSNGTWVKELPKQTEGDDPKVIEQLQKQIELLQQENATKEQQITSLNEQVTDLITKLQSCENDIPDTETELYQKVQEQAAEISSLNQQIQSLQEQLQHCQEVPEDEKEQNCKVILTCQNNNQYEVELYEKNSLKYQINKY